jgi:hypothetical protein
MPYLGKQAEEGGALISTYEFLQGTDTSTGASSFAVSSTGGDYVRVFLNGVLLQEGSSNDYTKTTAAVVITGTAPADGDLLKVDVYESITIWNTVPATGGTFSGNVIHSGTVTNSSTTTATGLITANGGLETDTNSKVKQKGAFMQSSTHQSWVMGG